MRSNQHKKRGTAPNDNVVIDVKDDRKYADEMYKNQYQLCFGGSTDGRVLTFMSKFIIVLSTLIFSFIMIITTESSGEKQIFIIIVNTILSVFLPSPSIKDKKDNLPRQ